MGRTKVILLAGGSGTRMGGPVPKQFLCVGGKPVIYYTLRALEDSPSVDAVLPVCIPGWEEKLREALADWHIRKVERVLTGGTTRYLSTRIGMEAACINVYAYSDLLYFVISLTNKSDIGYDAGDAQFTIETKKLSSKSLQSDKPIWPKSSYGKLACAPNSVTKIGYTIPKHTLQKNEVMKIYIYEKDGTRNLFLTLDAKDINYAVSPLN